MLVSRREQQIRATLILDLYRRGFERDEILKILNDRGLKMSERTYFRYKKRLNGFSEKDHIEHHKAKLERKKGNR